MCDSIGVRSGEPIIYQCVEVHCIYTTFFQVVNFVIESKNIPKAGEASGLEALLSASKSISPSISLINTSLTSASTHLEVSVAGSGAVKLRSEYSPHIPSKIDSRIVQSTILGANEETPGHGRERSHAAETAVSLAGSCANLFVRFYRGSLYPK